EGKTLQYSNDSVEMLLRDGRYFEFKPSDARNYRKTSSRFRSYSAGEMRSRLANELGKQFSITGTGHYLVAHPRGQKDLWANRFEDLYRDFVHYFSVRGLSLREPEFPMVAVVWKNKQDFQRNARRSGLDISDNVLGYYWPMTNRVHLFDTSSGRGDRAGWKKNAATIIHEVTHQTAYNTGVHTRFADTPTWVAEGLGTLFEAPGIHSPRDYRRQSDRINRGRITSFKSKASRLKDGFLVDLVG
ncbi:unnamed protein product, partial [marine sediment metagenome]